MADPIELAFAASAITARYEDGRAVPLGDVPAAVRMLQELVRARLPVRVEGDGPEAGRLARRTADLAGMRLDEREGRLYLLRPGRAPASLDLPAGAPPLARPAVRGPVTISLEPGLYRDSEEAYRDLIARRCGLGKPPKRFHDFGTQTFLHKSSTSVGRVASLYKNLRDLGPDRIENKLEDWSAFVAASADPTDAQFLAWFSGGVDPLDLDVLGDRSRVMPYFKFWTLMRLAAERREARSGRAAHLGRTS